MMSSDALAQWRYLAWSISHVVDILGWHQHTVLRRHDLGAIHMSLLLRAARQGAVSFDDIRRDTRMPIHSISRAAYRLEDRDLGNVVHNRSDLRRRRFRISQEGKDLLGTVEFETAKAVLVDVGAVLDDGQVWEDSRRYYEFTRGLWSLTGLLPDTGCASAAYYVPIEVPIREAVPPTHRRHFQNLYDALAAKRRLPKQKDESGTD
jgi:DNA-binding MarR family transcriptional regulator